MNLNRVVSIPNGSTALTEGMRVSLAVQGGVVVTVPSGTAAGSIGTVLRDVAAGLAAPAGTNTRNLGTYSTTDVNCPAGEMYGQVDGAITAGAAVYGQTGGQITATVTGAQIGIALETSTTAGQVIRYIPYLLI